MPLSEFKQGYAVCSKGEPLRNLLFITKGKAEAEICGQVFNYEQGDTIGLCALGSGSVAYTYTASTDLTVFSYPFENFDTLRGLLADNTNIANMMAGSVCRQISELLTMWLSLMKEADLAYAMVKRIYPEYERLCSLYALASKKLPGLEELAQASTNEPIEDWVYNYYTEINDIDPALNKALFIKPGISYGFVRRAAKDLFYIQNACEVYRDYLDQIAKLLLCEDGHDLFALTTELHINVANNKNADIAADTIVTQLSKLMLKMSGVDQSAFKKRNALYREALINKRSQRAGGSSSNEDIKNNLSDSLDIILEYSACSEEVRHNFMRCVHEYMKIPDKGSADDTVFRLRKEITNVFYDIYQPVFMKSLHDTNVPTIIKMFLNFGYVDAQLAGNENADYLYSIADSVKGDSEMGIYTVTEWLTAIYKGEKEPSRNDFDEDYAATVAQLKQMRKIDDKEEKRMLADNEAKVRFELENVFPVVNKITFGRITTFCPLFSAHNAQRDLETSLLTPAKIKDEFDSILAIDYSAYYRSTLYTTAEGNLSRDNVHMEILPDIILMPNMGIRSVMWQEIEGKKRTTPARMFIPLFLLVDLKQMVIRLTGEFRWEMCKRTQGSRWNDITDPSLTSQYFDYLQFYRSNRELSQDVKASIKTELTRAGNSYKSAFVSNYMDWVLYESNGSPRLNKFARQILSEQCPFPAEIREKLKLNPLYAEMLKKHNLKQTQAVKRMSNIIQKASQDGKVPAKELLNELEYLKK